MNDNPDLPDEERGLYAKYRVFKIEGDLDAHRSVFYENDLGQFTNAVEVTDPGMFLKFDDPAAQDAFWVYANSVKKRYPKLAADVKEQIYAAVERAQAFLAELDEIERQGRLAAGSAEGPSLKELVSRPDAASRYLEGLEVQDGVNGNNIRTVYDKVRLDREDVYPERADLTVFYQDGDPRFAEANDGKGDAVRVPRADGEICDWSGKAHFRQPDARIVNGCGWRNLHTYIPGAWPVEENDPDWELLEEDVTGHTMMHGVKHADGRNCAYHSRLQSWTFDGLYRCLRTDHPTLPGQ